MKTTEPGESHKAGVVIDSWKRKIFERTLEKAGFSFTVSEGLTPGTKLISVDYTDLEKLKPIIEKAQKECANTKLH